MGAFALLSGFIFIIILISLVPGIFYILTLQNTLKAISPQNRRMDPTHAWFLLIPFFNIVWHFIIVTKISESLEAEYRMRVLNTQVRPSYNLGLATSILLCCSFIPFLGGLASLGCLVTWIIYWVKVTEHKNNLEQMGLHKTDSQIF